MRSLDFNRKLSAVIIRASKRIVSLWIVLLPFTLLSCGDDDAGVLYIDLITDVIPDVEFTSVRVELGERFDSSNAARDDDFLSGLRIAEFDALTPGILEGKIVMEREGVRLVERPFAVGVRGGLQVVTVIITRDCLETVCPNGSDPSATACLADRCVDPRCSRETPEFCATLSCGDPTTDCPASAECAEASCVAGVCLYSERSGACDPDAFCDPTFGCTPFMSRPDASMPDAAMDAGATDAGTDAGILDVGTDACECEPGTMQGVPCGRGCGSGTRTCGDDCLWDETVCSEPTGLSSCWLWESAGGGWTFHPEPPPGTPNAPTSAVAAAFDIEAAGEAYFLTASTYHVMSIVDRTWVASGTLTSLLPGFVGSPRYAHSIPADHDGPGALGVERARVTNSDGQAYFFAHSGNGRVWRSLAPGSEPCCTPPAWASASAPQVADLQASWFDSTNARGIYNGAADPLCPAAEGVTGDIAFLSYLATPQVHYLEADLCQLFAPPREAERAEPFGGTRFGGSGPDPNSTMVTATFYEGSRSRIWAITE